MDTGLGEFAKISKDTAESIEKQLNPQLETAQKRAIGLFQVGEIVELKGSRFSIQSIGKTKMKLKLLKK